MGNDTSNTSDGTNRRVPEADASQRTPTTDIDPFKCAPRLGRSPTKVISVEKPTRAKLSSPALYDGIPPAKVLQSGGDYMIELREEIKN